MDLPQVTLNGARPCRDGRPPEQVTVRTLTPPAAPSPPPAPAAAEAAPTPNLPAVVLDGRHLTIGERALATAAHWVAGFARTGARHVTNPRGPWHAQPESLAMHDAYRRSRAWVPAGHEGKFIGPAGNAYHLTFARFGLLTGYGWAWLWGRPMRLLIALAAAGGIFAGVWLG